MFEMFLFITHCGWQQPGPILRDVRHFNFFTLILSACQTWVPVNLQQWDARHWQTIRAYKKSSYKTDVINDPLGQTHSLASSEHCFRLKFVLFC